MKIKECFVTRFEHGSLVEADLSQIEVVCQAYVTQCPALIKDVQKGIDFHIKRLAYKTGKDYNTLLKLYNLGDKNVTAERKKIKTVSFQLAYGAWPNSISKSLNIPKKEVEEIIAIEDKLYPEVGTWKDGMVAFAMALRESSPKRAVNGEPLGKYTHYSATGRTYIFYEEVNSYKNTVQWPTPKLINYPIQGLAGEVFRLWYSKICSEIFKRGLSYRCLAINIVHDAVYFDCVDKESVRLLKGIIEDVSESMHALINSLLLLDVAPEWTLPLRFEMKTGKNLLDMQTYN